MEEKAEAQKEQQTKSKVVYTSLLMWAIVESKNLIHKPV